jgi:hypothetical protein
MVYASNHEGWLPDDPGYYVRLFNYPLPSEPAYSPDKAASVLNFVCFEDSVPSEHPHGYPSSYRIAPALVGQNALRLTSNPRETVLVEEMGFHHRDAKGRPYRHQVFMDLHGERVFAPDGH